MQISPINKSYTPTFGDIKSRGNSSEKQIESIYDIKTVLRTENKDYKNKTPEQYYRLKGFDIGLTSLPDGKTVNISLYKRTNKREENLDQESFFSRESIDIGNYSNSEELNTKTMKDKYKASRGFFYNNIGILSFIATIILLSGIAQIKGAKAAALQSAEKAGETIDSIYNKFTDVMLK